MPQHYTVQATEFDKYSLVHISEFELIVALIGSKPDYRKHWEGVSNHGSPVRAECCAEAAAVK